ncbi:MAG: NUDIX hydrolase [Kiloniellales bacterium]
MSREYPEHPLCGVGVVVWRGDRLLLIRRARPPREGQWSLPGGLQELGETVFETAEREVREETGLSVAATELIDVVDLIERDGGGRVRRHYTLIDVTAEWRAGEVSPSDEVAEAQWFTLDAIPAPQLWQETVRIVRLSAERRSRRRRR